MKKYSLFFLFIVFFASISAQNTTKYFRRFYIDPRQYQLRTEIPISFESSRLTYAYRVEYDKNNRIIDVRYLLRGRQNIDVSGFSGMIINYLDSIEKRFYVNNFNKPIKNRGIYADCLVFNKEKHPIQLINYNSTNSIMKDIDGVAKYIWKLNDKGWIISEKFLDENDKPIYNKKGFFEEKYIWSNDDLNYYIRFEYYNDKGKLVKNQNGISAREVTFDKKTESLQKIINYDDANYLAINNNGFATSDFSYDKNGNRTAQFFYNKKNVLSINNKGLAIVKWDYDSIGNNTETAYYDVNKKLTSYNKTGVARIVNKFDNIGRLIEVRTYDKDNRLKENKKREAIVRWVYDENGKLITIKGYDANDRWSTERYKAKAKE